MRGNNVLGLIFANADEHNLPELTGVRSVASIPFGGSYRLIDFPLSGMVNAGISKVGIITNNNYQSLMDHIGSGKPWDLVRRHDEGLFLLPPFNADAIENYNSGRIGALKNISNFLARSSQEYVLLSDCTTVANIDFGEMFRCHEKSGNDITLLAKHGITPTFQTQPVFNEIVDGRITKMSIGKYSDNEVDYGLKAMILKKSLLERLVTESFAKGYASFEKDFLMKNVNTLKMGVYMPEGFCEVIDSLENYFKANFKLLDMANYKDLFNPARPVYTKVYTEMPAVYGLESDVKNSLVADGCIIEGTVENSILFRDCTVGKDAVVKNTIVMPHGMISEGAALNCCITDKSVFVRSGRVISGAESFPVYIGKNIQV